MNKTWKIVLNVIKYVCVLLLGYEADGIAALLS